MKKKRQRQAKLNFCNGKETEKMRKKNDGGERNRKRGVIVKFHCQIIMIAFIFHHYMVQSSIYRLLCYSVN